MGRMPVQHEGWAALRVRCSNGQAWRVFLLGWHAQPVTLVTRCPVRRPQDASKARESRLRKAGLQGRARMASELRDMDNDIAALSKALAVS